MLPYPTDLYFSGSTDGTLNSPVTPFLPNAATINALDGFSTVASSTVRFSAPIDPATISPATVIVLEVEIDNATKATVGFERALVYGTDYTRACRADDRLGRLDARDRAAEAAHAFDRRDERRLPRHPDGRASQDTSGNAATPDADYLTVRTAAIADLTAGVVPPTCATITNASLNGICRLTGAHLAIASGARPAR